MNRALELEHTEKCALILKLNENEVMGSVGYGPGETVMQDNYMTFLSVFFGYV